MHGMNMYTRQGQSMLVQGILAARDDEGSRVAELLAMLQLHLQFADEQVALLGQPGLQDAKIFQGLIIQLPSISHLQLLHGELHLVGLGLVLDTS